MYHNEKGCDSKRQCKTCVFGQYDVGNFKNGYYVCNYILITGHMRGCPADDCNKYEEKKRRRRQPAMTVEKRRDGNAEE